MLVLQQKTSMVHFLTQALTQVKMTLHVVDRYQCEVWDVSI